MEIEIKELNFQDLIKASEIFVDSFGAVGEMWSKPIALKRLEVYFKPGYCLGAFLGEEMIGVISTKEDPVNDHVELYVDILAVSPKFQNHHAGKLLLEKAEQLAKNKGFPGIWLLAGRKIPSYEFYKHAGYKETQWVAVYKKL